MGKIKMALALAVLIAVAVPAMAQNQPKNTAEALQGAYNRAFTMSTWYQACGSKADEENYGQAASLFRALGQAEKIHYSRYSDAIVKATGAMPKIEIAPPTVHDTKENLERAVKD